jgi:hypothetical protein
LPVVVVVVTETTVIGKAAAVAARVVTEIHFRQKPRAAVSQLSRYFLRLPARRIPSLWAEAARGAVIASKALLGLTVFSQQSQAKAAAAAARRAAEVWLEEAAAGLVRKAQASAVESLGVVTPEALAI